ncbi:glycoside hydrolase family 17 protein [Pseudohyphozyma bogoriensis]|nr:glycoside hydrolase family 17 protein [Pseudohyphozyma bogoriensis]
MLPSSLFHVVLLATSALASPIISPNALELKVIEEFLPPGRNVSKRADDDSDRYRPLVGQQITGAAPTPVEVTPEPTPTPAPTSSAVDDTTSEYIDTIINGFHTKVKNPKFIPNPKRKSTTKSSAAPAATSSVSLPGSARCFPANSPDIPSSPATASLLKSWWCPQSAEYAFMSYNDLLSDFKRMKKDFKARYVRLYGTCDNAGYNDDLVNAAAAAKIGVYGLVWFGFDGDDKWKTRMANLITTIKTNPRAPYVIRNIAVGSEPLYDWVMSQQDLAVQVNYLRSQLSAYGIQTTISEMPYGFQSQGDAPDIFKAIDIVEGNILPFFDSGATTGGNAWGYVSWAISYLQQHAPGKVIRMTQTGWPSNDSVWKANTATAVASVASEKAYFQLLDSKCGDLKSWGVGWFAQIWSDDQLGGHRTQFAAYVAPGGQFAKTKQSVQLGCTNWTDADYVIQYSQTFLCGKFTTIGYSASCNADVIADNMVCQSTCTTFGRSESALTTYTDICPAGSNSTTVTQRLASDLGSCTDFSSAATADSSTCISGASNEPNCGSSTYDSEVGGKSTLAGGASSATMVKEGSGKPGYNNSSHSMVEKTTPGFAFAATGALSPSSEGHSPTARPVSSMTNHTDRDTLNGPVTPGATDAAIAAVGGRAVLSEFKDLYSPLTIMPGSIVEAIYPYEASLPDELGINPGDTVEVVLIYDDNWAKGKIEEHDGTTRIGAFPLVCVTAAWGEDASTSRGSGSRSDPRSQSGSNSHSRFRPSGSHGPEAISDRTSSHGDGSSGDREMNPRVPNVSGDYFPSRPSKQRRVSPPKA